MFSPSPQLPIVLNKVDGYPNVSLITHQFLILYGMNASLKNGICSGISGGEIMEEGFGYNQGFLVKGSTRHCCTVL